MIKCIIFDLADVLVTGIQDTGRALVEKHNFDTGQRSSPLLTPLSEKFFHGNVSEDVYLDEVVNMYPQLGSKDELKRHIRDNFREVPGTRAIVLRLKQLGYRLALLSIHGKEWVEYADKKFNINSLFDAVAYSYEDKVSKPAKESFELILGRLCAQASECLFIDDTLVNIKAAREMGITAVQFSNAAELSKELTKLLPNYQE